MSRLVEFHPTESIPQLRRSDKNTRRLEDHLTYEIEQALAARHPQEEEWREAKRQYASIPKQPYRNTPVPNAPNIEVPLGAIATDTQYSAITDILYSASPVLSARAQHKDFEPHAKAMQKWANYCTDNEFGLRAATDHSFFDTCQLGTGAFYIPFVEDIYKHQIYNVRWRGPRILPVAPENFIAPGGSRGEIQRDRWTAVRFWYLPDEMRLRAKFRQWDLDKAIPIASDDWVRQRHEHVNLTSGQNNWKEFYEVLAVYCHFDYNDDGQDLDLLVHWDRSSRKVLEVNFNPYDSRPIVPMRYQIRPHLAYGLGIMAMMRPMQEEATEIHNHRIVNMMIANARVWIAQNGVISETSEIYPNKIIETPNPDGLKALQMGDVYPSSMQAEISTTALAEKRVGMEGGSGARSALPIGTRTPGITALTAVQAQNRRFTPAFDQMRMGAVEAMKQGFLRQRERLLMNDAQVAEHIKEVLGDDDGELVIELLKEPNFDRYVRVDFTAVSPSVNREADRQNAIMVGNMLKQYYSETMSLVTAIANPQVRPEVVEMAKLVISKSTESMDRLLRTFEQLRNPEVFLLNEAVDIVQGIGEENGALAGLSQAIAGAAPQIAQALGVGGGGGGAEAGAPAPSNNGAGAPALDSAEPSGTA